MAPSPGGRLFYDRAARLDQLLSAMRRSQSIRPGSGRRQHCLFGNQSDRRSAM